MDPDGTIAEFAYTAYGDTASEIRRDSATNLISATTNIYAYFTGTRQPASLQTEIRDAANNLLSKRLTTYTLQTPDGTNTADAFSVPASEKSWFGTNATDYTETRYAYTTNFLLAAQMVLIGPGTNDFRTVLTNSYDNLNRLAAQQDPLSNAYCRTYDAANRLASTIRTNSAGVAVTTSFFYDNLNRLTNTVHPDGICERWTYAPCGCGVLAHTDRGGNVTTNSYNSNKQLSKVRSWSTNGTLLSYV
ncbi:MAG: hypothetical protein ACOYOU_19775, partial [Kiritimatiellia bacterium]